MMALDWQPLASRLATLPGDHADTFARAREMLVYELVARGLPLDAAIAEMHRFKDCFLAAVAREYEVNTIH